jgi:hypothetical protein
LISKLRSRLTYANVMASIAVFIALGGTSYGLARGTIGSSELKNNSVRSKDIRNNQVSSADVRNSGLLAKDFKRGQLPAGPPGPTGPPGEAGAPGSARAYALIGSNGSVTRSKNVTGVSHTAASGIYCFDLPFTPDNAVATGARPGPGNFNFKTFVTTGVAPNLGSLSCVAPFDDAVAAVTTAADATSFDDEAFFIMFN